MNHYYATKLLSLITILSTALYAETALTAFSREEAIHEGNISKPRIVIKNTGTRPVHGFSFRYFINTENGLSPVVDNYYAPGAHISVESYGHGCYAVCYYVPGVTLYPGESYPDESGCVVGIHYAGWEPLFKNNDQSCNFSEVLVYNPEISIYSTMGHVVNGNGYRVISSRRERTERCESLIDGTVSVDIGIVYPGRRLCRAHR